jgi:hypothetical protein
MALPHPRQAAQACQQDLHGSYQRELALFGLFRKGGRFFHLPSAVPQNGGPTKHKLAMLKVWAGEMCDPNV